MKKLDLTKVPKLKPNPIFKGLPDALKNPESFKRIEDSLRLAILSDHQHKSVKEYVECKRCAVKLQRRQDLMKEFGFRSVNQYLEWKKIMDIITKQKSFQVK